MSLPTQTEFVCGFCGVHEKFEVYFFERTTEGVRLTPIDGLSPPLELPHNCVGRTFHPVKLKGGRIFCHALGLTFDPPTPPP